jgi:hypothetical protein
MQHMFSLAERLLRFEKSDILGRSAAESTGTRFFDSLNK